MLRAKIATQGIYKVSMVAKIATPETDKVFAEHVENMPKPVLLEFAKELRSANPENEQESGSWWSEDLDDSIKCKAVTPKITIELDEEMQILFNQLKKKYGKELSNKEALKAILKEAKKQNSLKPTTTKSKNVPGNGISDVALPIRTIPQHKKREITQKTNGKCAYPSCTKAIENFHHTTPFAFNRSHESIVGLCAIHHEFCHNGIIRNELKDPKNWKLNIKSHKSLYDKMRLQYKENK